MEISFQNQKVNQINSFGTESSANGFIAISSSDKIELLKEVNSNPELSNFVTEVVKTTKGDGYAKPENNWELGTIATDLMSLLNGAKRTKHLEVWKGNVEEIFSKENRYKLEAAYGSECAQDVASHLGK